MVEVSNWHHWHRSCYPLR